MTCMWQAWTDICTITSGLASYSSQTLILFQMGILIRPSKMSYKIFIHTCQFTKQSSFYCSQVPTDEGNDLVSSFSNAEIHHTHCPTCLSATPRKCIKKGFGKSRCLVLLKHSSGLHLLFILYFVDTIF